MKSLDEKFQKAQIDAMRDTLESLLDATEPSIPVDKGILKSSKSVQVYGNLVIAGFNTEYAWLNHQGIDRNGNKINRQSGKDYWFANTIKKNKDKLLKLYAEQLQKRLKM